MGLSSNSGGNTTFVFINGGRFKVKAKEGEPGAIARVLAAGPKKGETVWEHHYGELSGHIVELGSKDLPGDYGTVLEVTLQDDEGKYKLSLPYYKSQALDFLKRLKNVDPTKPVELSVWNVVKDNVTRTVLNVKQDGQTVPFAWTKENSGDLPSWEKIKTKKQGKVVEEWNFDSQFDWLILNVMLPFSQILKTVRLPEFKTPEARPEPEPEEPKEAEGIDFAAATKKKAKDTQTKVFDIDDVDEDELPF